MKQWRFYLGQSARMLSRDWRAGELRLLLSAVVIAVAALTSVTFFADRLSQALSSQARQLLGADAVLSSDTPIAPSLAVAAKAAGLSYAETVTFPSMVGRTGEAGRTVAPQLSSLKAVGAGYPLRGVLKIATQAQDPGVQASSVPERGTVWVDAQLLNFLGAKLGDQLELGASTFTVTQFITIESDRGASFVNFAPRAMINAADLPATQLIQPASRVGYRALIAGDINQVNTLVKKTILERGQRFEDLQTGRPEPRSTLDRAKQFLSLVALLAALIAATAIALASRRFAQRHLDGCAVIKALGATQSMMASLLILELCWVGLGASILGCALGFAGHFVLLQVASGLIDLTLPAPSIWPALQGAVAGFVLLMGFALFPIVRLSGVAPLRVLRRDLGAPSAKTWLAGLIALVCAMVLLAGFAGDIKLASFALGGFLLCALIFGAVAWALMRSVAGARHLGSLRSFAAIRVALAGWSKRGGASVAQMVALAIALMALLLLTVVRNDLLNSWRKASPPDAPNRFVINIQPDQKTAITADLKAAGIKGAELSPMIRGRLIRVNGKDIKPSEQADPRAQRLLDREFNLSYEVLQPSHNETISGRWIDPSAAEVSVEDGIAKTLDLKLNDDITFDIAGEVVSAKVVGIRKLSWDSMKVNFFMILSPSVLRDLPQTLITAVHVPQDKVSALDSVVRRYPNLTVFDTDNIVRQVQAMLDQVSRAVEYLFSFTLAAGLLVLYAAQSAGKESRQMETALMRALGASRKQLTRGLLAELMITGAISGLLASMGALAVAWALAKFVFQFELTLTIWPVVIGIVGGASASMLVGWWGLRSVVNTPPMVTLREG